MLTPTNAIRIPISWGKSTSLLVLDEEGGLGGGERLGFLLFVEPFFLADTSASRGMFLIFGCISIFGAIVTTIVSNVLETNKV